MHFEILVEGQAELTTLSILMEKMVGPYKNPHTWKIHRHRGLGRLPDCPEGPANKKDPSLLHNLPAKLRAYGKAMGKNEMVVVLVDLDDRPDCCQFKQDLVQMLEYCQPRPKCLFRMAVEELEAWFLGDPAAIRASYPHADLAAWRSYIQDSQCGTWEKLADVVYPGGMAALEGMGKRSRLVLEQKVKWAREISLRMDVEKNNSKSFQCFRDGLRKASHAM